MPTKTQFNLKARLIETVIEARQALLAAVSALPASAQEQVFLGIWSANDLVAHLAGWDEANLVAVQQVMDGRVPSFYDHHGPDWRDYNALLVAKYKQPTLAQTMALAGKTHRALLEFVQAVPAEDINRDFGVRFRGYKVTIRRILEAEAKDNVIHREQIEEFARSLAGGG